MTQKHFHMLARVLSLSLALPLAILLSLAITTPLTISGLLYVIGASGVIAGIWLSAWGRARFRPVVWFGVGLLIAIIALRLVLVNTSGNIRQLLLPDHNALCVLNCIFDEQDVALSSTRVLSLVGWVSADEQVGLLDALYANYSAMAKTHPFTPSPFARTYLNQQRPDAFDAVVIEPDGEPPSETGVIFLHGFTGNFTMPCWLIAEAARAQHALTVCPSVGWDGHWWTAGGEATLRATIAYLHERGANRIYLAGLSNGAVGASELAFKLTDDIAGLILISGAAPNASDSGLPVLVLAGSHDSRMPAAMLRAYANRMGNQAVFVELPSDHFMLSKDYAEVQRQIAAWLEQH